jgi:hypothetical protein
LIEGELMSSTDNSDEKPLAGLDSCPESGGPFVELLKSILP